MHRSLTIVTRLLSIVLVFFVLTFGLTAIADSFGWRIYTVEQTTIR